MVSTGMYGAAYTPVTRDLPKVRDVEIKQFKSTTKEADVEKYLAELVNTKGWTVVGKTQVRNTNYSAIMVKELARQKGANTVVAFFQPAGIVEIPETKYYHVPLPPQPQPQQINLTIHNQNAYSPYPYVNSTNTAQGGLLESLNRWNASRRAVTTYKKRMSFHQRFVFLRSPSSR